LSNTFDALDACGVFRLEMSPALEKLERVFLVGEADAFGALQARISMMSGAMFRQALRRAAFHEK